MQWEGGVWRCASAATAGGAAGGQALKEAGCQGPALALGGKKSEERAGSQALS